MGLLKQPPWVLQAEAQSAWGLLSGLRAAREEEAEHQEEEAEHQDILSLSCIECESCLGDC